MKTLIRFLRTHANLLFTLVFVFLGLSWLLGVKFASLPDANVSVVGGISSVTFSRTDIEPFRPAIAATSADDSEPQTTAPFTSVKLDGIVTSQSEARLGQSFEIQVQWEIGEITNGTDVIDGEDREQLAQQVRDALILDMTNELWLPGADVRPEDGIVPLYGDLLASWIAVVENVGHQQGRIIPHVAAGSLLDGTITLDDEDFIVNITKAPFAQFKDFAEVVVVVAAGLSAIGALIGQLSKWRARRIRRRQQGEQSSGSIVPS